MIGWSIPIDSTYDSGGADKALSGSVIGSTIDAGHHPSAVKPLTPDLEQSEVSVKVKIDIAHFLEKMLPTGTGTPHLPCGTGVRSTAGW
jgi:hypothetical protein